MITAMFDRLHPRTAQWLIIALATTMVLTVVSVATAGKARAGYDFLIKSRANNLCLDVAGWRTDGTAPIIQWECHGGANQRFEVLEAGSGGNVVFRNLHSNLCIDLAGWDTRAGAKMIQWQCHFGNNQKFKIGNLHHYNGILSFEAKNAHSQKCLDVPGGTNQLGVQIQQWWCNNHPAQQWYYR